MRRVSALALSLGLFLGTTAQAADAKCVLQKMAELPVTMSGMAPLVKAKINGADTYLMADSGAFYSIISAAAASRYGMTYVGSPFGMTVRGTTGSAPVEVYAAKDFTLSDIPLHNIQFLVGGRELSGEAAGVLGQNVLGLMDVEYDLANGMIRLFKPQDCGKMNLAYWSAKTGASVLPIEPMSPQQREITALASVNGQPIRVIFDTGASTSILKRASAERVGIHLQGEDVKPAGLAYGFGRRAAESWIAPVSNFTLGDEQIQNTRLRVGDIDLGKDMLLGADFFLSHRVYVSNSQHKLYFTYNGGPVFKLDRQPPPRVQADAASSAAGITEPAKDDQEPTDAAGFSRRGSAFVARHDFVRAVADFTRAVELEPNIAQHYYDRAMARLNMRQPVLAMADLDQALKLNPTDAHGLLIRGELYLSEGDITRANLDFDAAQRAAPDDANLGLGVAGAYQRSGRFEAAVSKYDVWITAHPKNDRLAQALNGRCWTRALWGHDLDKALIDCDAALKQGLRNSTFLDSRGLVHLRFGQMDAAIADYDAALKLQPKSAWSLYGKGLAEQKKGAAAAGAADIQAGLAIQPGLATTAKRFGIVDAKTGGL